MFYSFYMYFEWLINGVSFFFFFLKSWLMELVLIEKFIINMKAFFKKKLF